MNCVFQPQKGRKTNAANNTAASSILDTNFMPWDYELVGGDDEDHDEGKPV
jgi:hypothetical protein